MKNGGDKSKDIKTTLTKQSLPSGETLHKLLVICEAVADARESDDLLKIIFEQLRPLIPFDNAPQICVLNPDGETMRFLLGDGSEKSFAYKNTPFELGLTANSPQIYTSEYLVEHYADFEKTRIPRNKIKEILTVALRHRGELTGSLELYSRRADGFGAVNLDFFQSVADHIAVAAAHILANENLKKREQAQTLLYRISRAIASVKDGRELLKIIVEYAQPIFGFYDIGLSVLDKSGEFYLDWATFYTEINPSEANLENNRRKIYQMPAAEPLFRYTFERVARDNKPFIENLNAEFIERFGDYPQLEVEIAHGYKQFLVTTLRFGGADIGILNFNSLRENHFEPSDFELFQAIADLVAVAVANITANEEILEREQEKAKLLSISREIAKVQTRRQLLDVIFNRIKSIFPYDDAGLFYFCDPNGNPDPHGVCHVHLLDDLISEVNFELMQKGLSGVVAEGTDVIRFLATDKAQIISLQRLMQTIPEHPHFPIMEEMGIKQLITVGIKSGGATIGMLCFNSCREDFYSEKDFPLFENITNQVAVALTNILANEEILERTREKSVLLSISEDIASARNAVELLQIICEKAQKLIPFFDTGILIVEEDGEHHYDLAVNLPGWDTSDTNQKLHALGFHRMIHPNSYVEYVMNLIEAANSPVIEDYEKRYREFDYPFFTTLEELGYQEAIVTTLKTGGKTFGTLWLNALEKNHFSPKQFEVFQTLADQVAVAVSNILANEEILEREREKEILLSISQSVAAIQNHEQLLKVIFEKIKPIFKFHDVGLFILSGDGERVTDWAGIYSQISPSPGNSQLEQFGIQTLPFENSPIEFVINQLAEAGRPRVFAYDKEYIESAANADLRLKLAAVIKEGGYREFIAVTLKTGGKLLGTLFFNSRQSGHFNANQFSMFQSVADQLAVAISNILANDDILEREREKTMLLSISEAIATVRDKDELFGIFNDKLRPILSYDYASVLEADNERQTYRYYLTISDQSLEANELYQAAARFRPFNPYIASVLDSAAPVVYLTDDLLKQYPNGAGLKLQQSLGVKQSIVFVLKNAGQTVGLFILHYKTQRTVKPEQSPLFRNIANQVAVALGNILANEEIERKLVEIKTLKTQLEIDNSYLVEEVKTTYNFEEIIGSAPVLRKVFEQIELVAPTNATVLLEGETGTGKELFARAIHNLSPRGKRPLIKINCAALPRELVESELFGHERGSFTGATERRIGKFELANNGTIFLDEIGELPLELQAKLLRVLQEQELERVGGKSPLKLDIRVIAATNRNLREEVAARRFRSDLYFRLNTVTLELPPLRERREDVPALAMHFVEKFSNRTGKRIKSVATAALQELMQYDFPGNIRELEHLIEESVIFSKSEKLVLHRPLQFNRTTQTISDVELNGFRTTLADNEREHILSVLRQTDGRIRGGNGAAEILNIKPTTLEARMKRLGIEKRHIFDCP